MSPPAKDVDRRAGHVLGWWYGCRQCAGADTAVGEYTIRGIDLETRFAGYSDDELNCTNTNMRKQSKHEHRRSKDRRLGGHFGGQPFTPADIEAMNVPHRLKLNKYDMAPIPYHIYEHSILD